MLMLAVGQQLTEQNQPEWVAIGVRVGAEAGAGAEATRVPTG